MAIPFGSIGQLALGNLVSRGADRLLNPEQKNNKYIDTVTGGGYTGKGTSGKSKGKSTFTGIAKQGIMGLIARSILGPILGPLALTLGTNIFNKNPNLTKGLGFFNQDGSDGPPIGPGINLTQQQIYDMDDVDPADYGLVDAATADIQDFADIMPDDSSDPSGGPKGVDAGTANIQDYADIMPDDSSDSSGGGGGNGTSSSDQGETSSDAGFSDSPAYDYARGGLASLYR
tara:strand:- start:30 stop:719 length:690 start_codon:yes stop_codon:yes gene_type:complete